ncbi:S1/P1 nuclease [Chryseobacterium gotjawalense]|uniref:S1/P1 nuclease n=1 Tax=Chryseobacterium gotjawalense TaxID=3042315 RepID=A0ABY8RDT9_9FLAO|nr:S1/P1 nuclease [Chryseobacterium sp. wdc7]WHF52136.1 S1/P1 nuclease [Chryseobacterium sp. wdc7]
MNRILQNSVLLLALLSFNFGYSWGTTGHRVIAEIAENHLSGKAKRSLKKIIGTEKLAYWANWPDDIKSDTTGVWKPAEQWHYVNVAPQSAIQPFTEALKAQKGPNIYTQIKILSEQIKDKKTSAQDREIALRFLIHLVGDAAQPLHVGRLEDLGGNKIKVNYFGAPTNLHSLWDSKMVDFQKYSYTEFARVLDVKTKEENKSIQLGTLEDWLFDSHRQANRIYANSIPDANYSYDYNYKFEPLVERQLLYGGLRLAKILNEIL